MKIPKKRIIQRRDIWRRVTSPYCPVCTSCAEDGCCPPTLCSNDPKGKWCTYSMEKLKNTYRAWEDLMNFIYRRSNKDSINIEDLKQKINELDDNYNLI